MAGEAGGIGGLAGFAERSAGTSVYWIGARVADGQGQPVNAALDHVGARHPRLKGLPWTDAAARHLEGPDADRNHLLAAKKWRSIRTGCRCLARRH